jgi:hypothetical protein
MSRNIRKIRKRIGRSTSAPGRPSSAGGLNYAQVEAVLAKVFDAEDVQHAAFRGRLKHFRKLGIPAQNPGKGSRVQYAPADLFQLLMALELSELGLDPVLIAKRLRKDWENRAGFFAAIELAQVRRGDQCLALLRLACMSASFGRRRVMEDAAGLSLKSSPPAVEVWFVWPTEKTGRELVAALQQRGERLTIFNLSERVHAVEDALKALPRE